VVAPFLSRFLDRHRGSLRLAVVVASIGRGVLAWLLATRLDSLYLFPIAFGILVLSRAALVVKGALLPDLAPDDRPLVKANASLSKVSALAGMVAVPPGLALLRFVGPNAEVLFAACVYFVGAVPAVLLPMTSGRRGPKEQARARLVARGVGVRQAIVAIAGMRFLVGFLVLHLAFALRREELSSVGLGVLVGSAAAGSLLGALTAPVLKRKLREEGILAAGLLVAGVTGVLVGSSFSVATAALLVAIFSLASGAGKVAFDAIVQRDTPPAARGWAFARFESVLQIAWVAGALVPLGPSIPSGVGVLIAGIAASLLAVVYTLGRRRVAAARLQ
jgi:hypothetical protein